MIQQLPGRMRLENPSTGLQLRSKREFNKTLKKALRLEIGKRAVRIFSGLRTIKNWTLWRVYHPVPRSRMVELYLHSHKRLHGFLLS
jgi:hypothetical protein